MKRSLLVSGVVLAAMISFSLYAFSSEKGVSESFPFYPSLLNTSTGKPIKPEDFESSQTCMGCHSDIYTQWKGSMHSSAFIDPVFQALWKIGDQETEGFTRNLCGGCHGAIGVMSNDLSFKNGEFVTSDIAREGVHCDLCHTIKASSFLETPAYEPHNASLIVEPGRVKRGPRKDAVSPYHETAYSELHTTSKFCANCHNVFHPVTNFPIERTYDEWKFSVYAQHGIQCQDCHMMPIDKAVEAARTLTRPVNPGKPCVIGPMRDNTFTHEFVGANFAVPELLGDTRHAELARQRLRSAAELDILAPAAASRGTLVAFSVKVTNAAAGHNLPTSLTEVRQMWLDVSITDAAGTEVLRSGNLNDAGDIINDPRIFNSHALDKDGKATVKPWEIARYEYNKTIPPKGSATERYAFLVPADAQGPLTVKAVLRYRSYSQQLANQLLGSDAPVVPIVDMQKHTHTVAVN